MIHLNNSLRAIAVLFLLAGSVTPAFASKDTGHLTSLAMWRAADDAFAGWSLTGTTLADGFLTLDSITSTVESDPYPLGGYYGGNFYNGTSYRVGEALSPEMETSFSFLEAIPSWNAAAPAGSWIEIQMRARLGTRWTKWYNLGVWDDDNSTLKRHSVKLQGDTDGYVATDTLVISNKKELATGYQVKVRLFSADSVAVPSVSLVSVAYSNAKAKKPTYPAGNPAMWGKVLDVPQCSQMVYPDGGNVWCSPTSTSMVLGYWGWKPGPCADRVQAAVAGVYDWVYDGHGNWPFNTAFAGSQGMEAYVARYSNLAELEPWIAKGIPVVMSVAWSKGDLTNATVNSTAGHLIVLVGFDAAGNGVVNDPAGDADNTVRRTYLRAELEKIWQENSSGTVYLIYPQG